MNEGKSRDFYNHECQKMKAGLAVHLCDNPVSTGLSVIIVWSSGDYLFTKKLNSAQVFCWIWPSA